MKRSLALTLALSTVAVAAGSFFVVGSARAEDAAAPAAAGGPTCPPPQKTIEHPFLTAAVGDWVVDYTTYESNGTKHEGKATSKTVLGIGGTALVEDYEATDMMGPGKSFFGHGVCKASDDGKTVTCWWFDTMRSEPMKLTGPLTDTTLEMSGTIPGMGTMKIVSKKVEGGVDWDATIDGKPMLTQKYRKAK